MDKCKHPRPMKGSLCHLQYETKKYQKYVKPPPEAITKETLQTKIECIPSNAQSELVPPHCDENRELDRAMIHNSDKFFQNHNRPSIWFNFSPSQGELTMPPYPPPMS